MLIQEDNRFPDVSGSVNLRDIGGYQTSDGRLVRFGLVFRSGTLAELDEVGIGQFSQLGIGKVFDLRSAEERSAAPSQLPDSSSAEHVPIKDPSNFARLRVLKVLIFQRNALAEVLYDAYTRVMIDGNGIAFGHVLTHIAENDSPTLVHCTAGKDRTGLTMALLLTALGVPRQTILDDYALSGRYEQQIARRLDGDLRMLRRLRLTDAQIRPLLQANPDLMARALDYIDQHHGSVEAYLFNQCGLNRDVMERLQARLLSDDGK